MEDLRIQLKQAQVDQNNIEEENTLLVEQIGLSKAFISEHGLDAEFDAYIKAYMDAKVDLSLESFR